jgi:Virulence protein RhuM family
MDGNGNIIFYQTESGNSQIEVKLENDTVWLSLTQLAVLFDRDKSVISKHLSGIFKEKELIRESVVAKNATTAADGKKYQVDYFNLDVIISIGYRVKSVRGTQFRIWANQVLKEYLVRGYAIDQKRFQDQSRQLEELKQTVKLLGNVIENKTLNSDEATGLLKVVTDYTIDRHLTNASIIRITSAPSSPLQGLAPSPKKYCTTAAIIGCCTWGKVSKEWLVVTPCASTSMSLLPKTAKLIFPAVPTISQWSVDVSAAALKHQVPLKTTPLSNRILPATRSSAPYSPP